VLHGTSQEGFEAEWRIVEVLTREGDAGKRCEIFDEGDVDAALARFDELCSAATQLENAASRVYGRLQTYFAARDWDVMAAMLADQTLMDDRRRVVNAGVRRGRDATMAGMRAIAEVGATNITSVAIATRGTRLALCRTRAGRSGPEAFDVEALQIVDIDADERLTALVSFGLDDLDAACEELDARYLTGEAASHAHTWSLIAGAYAVANTHELPELTPEAVNLDHRRARALAPGEWNPYMDATWDLAPDVSVYIEAVHRLGNLGAVVTHAAHGTSRQGFAADWREISILTFDRDLISRVELFDEADLDSAIATFDELSQPAPILENAATRTWTQIVDACNRRDADGFLALTSEDGQVKDRRKGLGAFHEGSARRKAAQAMCRAPKSWRMEVDPIAIRGHRLGLTRERWRDTDEADRPITVEALTLTEVTGDELVRYTETFDPDDINGAIGELDARYLAGEGAAHAHTWSVIGGMYAALNRRELPPTTPDWVNIDHRRLITIDEIGLGAYLRASWELSPQSGIYIEAVHRLSTLGAVVTHVVNGTAQEGFDAQWRSIDLLTLEGERINRCELFDEADVDAAVTRFDELNRGRSA
jgi:hypothetical protein